MRGCCIGVVGAVVGAALALTYSTWEPSLGSAVGSAVNQFEHGGSDSSARPSSPAAANPGGAPPVFVVPTPAPTPVVRWSGADCSFAVSTLQTDARLDAQAARDYAVGTRTPPAGSTALAMDVYYAKSSARWQQDAFVAERICAAPPHLPSAAEAQSIVSQFTAAIAGHQAAYANAPAWNSTWIANYRRLSALFGAFA